jgi:predicted dehydrogenase
MDARGLRFGLIGAGPWGRNFISTIAELEDVRLARIASSNPETRALAGLDCEVTPDWRKVVESPDLDGVVIATPPATHLEIALQAIGKGLAVLIEKPLCLDADEALRFAETAQLSNTVIMLDHTYLFHPAYRRLKQLTAARGGVDAMVSEAGNWGPFRSDTPVLWDWGAHDVAMAIDLAGAAPRSVAARQTEQRELDEGTGESFALTFEFAAMTAEISISNMRGRRVRKLEAHTGSEHWTFDDTSEEPLTGPVGDTIPCDRTLPLAQAVIDFADAIRAGEPRRDSLKLGVAVTETLAACDDILGRA